MIDIVFGNVNPGAESLVSRDVGDALGFELGIDEIGTRGHAQSAPAGPLDGDAIISPAAAMGCESVEESIAAGVGTLAGEPEELVAGGKQDEEFEGLHGEKAVQC